MLLSSLALTAIIGTVVPQNENPDVYMQAYGDFLYMFFNVLDIFDMYHAWWFQLLLLLLAVNLLVCSVERLSKTWKIIFIKKPVFIIDRFRTISNRVEFDDQRTPEQLRQVFEPVINRSFKYLRIDSIENGFCIFAEKWRWTRLGVYVVHLSVILLLLGGIVGNIFGFSGHINVREGETVNSIHLRKTGQIEKLDFEIRCDDFNVTFNNDGSPKEFRSSLTIIEKGKPVLKKDIIVNDPLRYKGISIYQASYGEVPGNSIPQKPVKKRTGEDILLNFTSTETGVLYQKKTTIGKEIDIPGKKGKFTITGYKESADFMGQNIGEAYMGILVPEGQEPVEVLLPLHFPNFDKMRKDRVIISIADQEREMLNLSKMSDKVYYTGLQVAKDPGVWFVYSGFILMLIGCYITFFMPLQRICIEIQKDGKKTRVYTSGTSNKNKTRMEYIVKKISEKLGKL